MGTMGSNTTGTDTDELPTTSDTTGPLGTSGSSSDSDKQTINDTIVGQDDSSDGSSVSDETTTTDDVPSTDDTSSTSGNETSSSSSSDTSSSATSDTSSDTSSDTTSESSDSSGSSDSGTEPCVPQLCFSVNANQSYDNSRWTQSYIYGSPFSFTSDRRVTRAEVFTGENSGTASLQIWNDFGNGKQPESQIAAEDWSIVSQNEWQEANFESPIPADAGTTYWLVISVPYRSQAPMTASGQIVQVAASSDNGNQWLTADEINEPLRWMYKIYCCESGY